MTDPLNPKANQIGILSDNVQILLRQEGDTDWHSDPLTALVCDLSDAAPHMVTVYFEEECYSYRDHELRQPLELHHAASHVPHRDFAGPSDTLCWQSPRLDATVNLQNKVAEQAKQIETLQGKSRKYQRKIDEMDQNMQKFIDEFKSLIPKPVDTDGNRQVDVRIKRKPTEEPADE